MTYRPAPAGPQTSAGVPELPPGPSAPRAVQTLAWTLRTGPFLDRNRARFGDQFTIKIGDEPPWVVLSDPEAVKQVFTGDPRLLHAGEGNVILKPILGEHSVLLLDERPHLRQRRLLLPPLHGERMQQYGELMRQVAEEEVARWPRGEPLVLHPRMQAVTLEVIMRAVFGLREGERLERLRVALRQLLDRTTSVATLMLINLIGPGKMMRVNSAIRLLDTVDQLIIEEVRERRGAADLAERDDILSLLLQARHEDGNEMSDRELRDELMTLLVAGHETSATTLSWALERLVRHPEQLERLRDGGDEYADAVLKETLRLRPVLPDRGPAGQGADRDRRPAHPRRGDAGALHLPRAPAPRRLPRAAALRARALPGREGGDVHVVPVRRRRAPLPGRVLRDVRDDDRAAGDDRAAEAAPGAAAA